MKLSVPLVYSIQAKVQLQKFSFINLNDPAKIEASKILPDSYTNIKDIFKIPKELERVSRKEGMKTLKNKNKRLMFANFNIN